MKTSRIAAILIAGVVVGCANPSPLKLEPGLTAAQQLEGWLKVQAALEGGVCETLEYPLSTYCWVGESQEGVVWSIHTTDAKSASAEVWRCTDKCPEPAELMFRISCEDGVCH